MSTRSLYVTFIGIDAYPQSPLSGCIKDVLDMDLLLREQAAQQEDLHYMPAYFLAPNTTDVARIDDYERACKIKLDYKLPTFEIVTTAAFAHLKKGLDNDILVLFYSGHGSQIEAPEEFWHTKPDRQNETIVCVDSRDPRYPGSRDIIDKELAFLLWDTLKDKNNHCLVIMDCCHSGNNTRGVAGESDLNIKFRYTPSSKNKIPLKNYLGYDENFYEVTDGKAKFPIAKYVHLAAARDSEKAQETFGGGLFTSKLIEALRSGGTLKSYRELVQGLHITISNRASQQNPVAFSKDDNDLNLRFLGDGIKPYQPTYEVRYDFDKEKWLMFGGAMHNIMPSLNGAKTMVKINGAVNEIAVQEVGPVTSILDAEGMTAFNKKQEDYQAVVVRMANPPIKVGLSPELLADTSSVADLKKAYDQAKQLFYVIDFEKENTLVDYTIQRPGNNAFILTKRGSTLPLFKREISEIIFLKNIDVVSKWISVSELKNVNTEFLSGDFIFTIEKIEGKSFTSENTRDWDNYESEKKQVSPGDESMLSYMEKKQPAFRFSIAINDTSKLPRCYIGALYLDSKFGIVTDLIRNDNNQLIKGGSAAELSWTFNNDTYKSIILNIDTQYAKYNINEITEFLKIFISTEPINLDRYKQESLELDSSITRGERGIDVLAEGNAEEETDWTVFTFPLRIVGTNKQRILKQGVPAEFLAFKIEVPVGFTATAFAATGNDLQQKLKTVTGSNDPEKAFLSQMILPPASIWGDTLTAETTFVNGMSPASDNDIRVLELFPDNAGTELKINEGEEILVKSKDLSAPEEAIVLYGYSEALQLYYPVGFSDDAGCIHIRQLPLPTPGLIRGDAILTRSAGSVKLFFKKVQRIKKINTLALYALKPGEAPKKITDKPGEINAVLGKSTTTTIALVIHGPGGGTRHITESLIGVQGFSSVFQYILTYDYENLSTPIIKTAQELHTSLSEAGFGSSHQHKLCIIAHSSGGLVTRWLVEKEGATDFVEQVILIGTPNAGWEVAHIKNSVAWLMTQAMNLTGPIKYALTGLTFLLKRLEGNPGKVMEEIYPDSEFLTQLASSPKPPGIKYNSISGDISLLEKHAGNDFFLQRIAEAFRNNMHSPGLSNIVFKGKPNDMVVSLESMGMIKEFDPDNMHMVAGNHLSYFSENASLEKLIELIKQDKSLKTG
ncbi:MAG: caspase family protein [Chitinophagaceae bacterium]